MTLNHTARILNDFTNDYIRNLRQKGLIEDHAPVLSRFRVTPLCPDCGRELTYEVISTDADGNRPEYQYVCTRCN